MKIEVNQILPYPISELDYSSSEIWLKNLIFEQGKNYFISSQSGKGKTTLLSCLYGNRKDYDGEVLIDGNDIKNLNNKKLSNLRKNHLSTVFQGLFLFDKLSGLENILLKNNICKTKSLEEIYHIADILEVKQLLQKKTAKMSYGQQQRIAIIRSLCQDFDFLLLDEPFSHLDDSNIEKTWNLISDESKKQNASIIITSLGKENLNGIDKSYLL